MRVKGLLFIFFSFLSLFSWGQVSTTLPTIIPPSPNVAAFQKYGNIPVSAYTGVPNISIPLYQIVCGDISVPISLSYHASGIKVSEESSRVGLGWVLNAGGMVSRSVMGADDFLASPNSYMDNATHTQPDIVSGLGADKGNGFTMQYGCAVNIPTFPDISNYLTTAPTYDFQPDQFYFNFLSHSGKFILKSSGAAIVDKQEKINIQFSDAIGTSCTITTADGTVYLFSQYETYTDFTAPGSPLAVKSAWYLTSIKSPTGNLVTFQYNTATSYINSIGGYSETQNPSLTYHVPGNNCSITSPSVNPTGTHGAPVLGKLYTNVYLSKIIFRSGEVDINYADDRQDIQNDRRITGIQVYSYPATGAAILIKTWQFYQSYFSGTGDQDYILGVPLNYVTQRMRLDSVKELNSSGSSIPPYQFAYNNSSDNVASLPAKTSFAKDHWGYFNGKVSNYSLVPIFFPTQSSNPVVFAVGTMGDNRNTDPAYSSLFQLNQITYPTGGNTQFQFESNDFDLIKSEVNNHSWYTSFPATRGVTESVHYAGGIVDQPTTSPTDIAAKTLDLTTLYIDPTSSTSPVSLTAFFRFNQNETSCALPQFYGLITFSLTNAATGQAIDHGELFTYLGATSQPMSTCVNGFAGILFSNTYNLAPGKYIWQLHMGPTVNVISDVMLNVNFLGIASALSPTDFGGGLRVKRITSNDNIGINPPKVKRYSYGYLDGAGVQHSYGIRMARPIYSYIQRQFKEMECDFNGGKAYFNATIQNLMYGSDSNVPLNGSASGSVVGYDSVTEYIGENGENGKTLYVYKNSPDIILDYSNFDNWDYTNNLYRMPRRPPVCSTIPFNDNGNLIEQADYANINGTYFKIKDVFNTYYYQTSQSQWQWYGLDIRQNGTFIVPNACNDIDVFVYPAIVSTWVTPATTVEYNYSIKNIGTVLSKTTNYTFSNPAHMQMTQKTETLSNGQTRTSQFMFPADFTDAQCDAALLSMKNTLFMHNHLVMKTEWLTKPDASQWITDGTIQKYKSTNGILVPAEIASLSISASQNLSTFPAYNPSTGAYPTGFESKLLFDKYDNYGNTWQDHKTNDIVHSYIWDYFNSYPIAEVINGDSSSIAFTSFEANGSGNWTIGSTIRNTTNFLTGLNGYTLSNGNITKSSVPSGSQYVVSYWSFNGAANVNGVTPTTGPVRKGWTYYEHLLPSTTTSITVSGTSTIDELRLYPSSAKMTSYTYQPLFGLSSTSDVNNRINFYEYDGFQRLIRIRDQDGNILKTYEYHYQSQVGL
jgi:YD repeat-containing protein